MTSDLARDSYLDITSEGATKEKKINTLNNIKTENFCSWKTTIKKVKRETRDWEKNFQSQGSGFQNI